MPDKTFQERLDTINYQGELPEYLYDPITSEIIEDPIILPTEQTISNSTWQDWIQRNKANKDGLIPCPVTGNPIKLKEARRNLALNNLTDVFVTREETKHSAQIHNQQYNIDSSIPLDIFKCPISLELMDNPVILPNGQTYSEQAWKAWVQSSPKDNNGRVPCPLTRDLIDPKTVIRNLALKNAIEAFVSQKEAKDKAQINNQNWQVNQHSIFHEKINPIIKELANLTKYVQNQKLISDINEKISHFQKEYKDEKSQKEVLAIATDYLELSKQLIKKDVQFRKEITPIIKKLEQLKTNIKNNAFIKDIDNTIKYLNEDKTIKEQKNTYSFAINYLTFIDNYLDFSNKMTINIGKLQQLTKLSPLFLSEINKDIADAKNLRDIKDFTLYKADPKRYQSSHLLYINDCVESFEMQIKSNLEQKMQKTQTTNSIQQLHDIINKLKHIKQTIIDPHLKNKIDEITSTIAQINTHSSPSLQKNVLTYATTSLNSIEREIRTPLLKITRNNPSNEKLAFFEQRNFKKPSSNDNHVTKIRLLKPPGKK